MRSFAKVCLIICLALGCVGGICLCTGVALGSGAREAMKYVENEGIHLGNWHIGKWSVYYGDEEDYGDIEVEKGMLDKTFPAEEVNGLDIDIKYGEVYLVTGDTDQIKINIDATKRNAYTCENEDGEIILKDKSSIGIRKLGSLIHSKIKVTVSIPEGKAFDEVEIKTDAGSAEISHSLTANEISLNVDAGEINAALLTSDGEIKADIGAGSLQVGQFLAASLDVECGMGEAALSGTVTDEADISCGMGSVELNLDQPKSAYDFELSCGLGSICLNEQEFSSMGTKQKIGNNNGAEIRLDCGLGELNVTTKED